MKHELIYKDWPNNIPSVRLSRWTKEAPTVPGWYWYKRNDGRKVMALIEDGNVGLFYRLYGTEYYFRVDQPDGEWSERIEPPE